MHSQRMRHLGVRHICRIHVLLIVVLVVPIASADISNIIFSVDVSNANGNAKYIATMDQGAWDPATSTFEWALPAQTALRAPDSPDPIATLVDASVEITPGHVIRIDFEVIAGTTTTVFVIRPGRTEFRTIPRSRAEGRATAAFGVSDLDGDGAALAGLGTPGTGAFRAYYNGNPPQGRVFAHLIARVTAGPGGSGSGYQNDPAWGTRPIGEAVDKATSQIAFTLTPNDNATGFTMYLTEGMCPLGDMNCDGLVANNDIDPFTLAVVQPDQYEHDYPDCTIQNGDLNRDGIINNYDIDAFVELISSADKDWDWFD